MTEQKQPMPGEWWVSNCDDEIAYICGFDPDGDPVYMTDGVNKPNVETMSGFLENWHHEPSCTSFDWKPPAPIDPGEGWEVLVKPCRLEQDDEALHDGKWYKTCYAGTMYIDGDENIYRRMKPTAEQWPKYVVNDNWSLTAYLIRDSETSYTAVHVDGTEEGVKIWDKHCSILIDQGTWRYVTESEALARVKPAEVWPKYAIGAANKLYRADSWEKVFWIDCGGNEFLQADPLYYKNKWHEFKQITETEANAMWKPAESIPQAVERTATPLATAAVESPDDWVEITDTHPGHIRRACDEVCCKGDDSPIWIPVQSSIGMPQSEWGFTRIRCRRRDLPAQQPKRTPVRLWCYRYILKDGQSSTVIARHEALQNTTDFRELFYDGSGFYVEGE